LKRCSICQQKADLYTKVHRKEPFADGRLYDCVCFTCYFVPKTVEQKYDEQGSVAEEVDLGYSCENLCEPKELADSGMADSLRQARASVEAVRSVCSKSLKIKKPRKRPETSWSLD
jgi:hypothetical protein